MRFDWFAVAFIARSTSFVSEAINDYNFGLPLKLVWIVIIKCANAVNCYCTSCHLFRAMMKTIEISWSLTSTHALLASMNCSSYARIDAMPTFFSWFFFSDCCDRLTSNNIVSVPRCVAAFCFFVEKLSLFRLQTTIMTCLGRLSSLRFFAFFSCRMHTSHWHYHSHIMSRRTCEIFNT